MTHTPPNVYRVSAHTNVRVLDDHAMATPLRRSGVLADDQARPVGPFTEFVAADRPFALDTRQPTTAADADATIAVVDHTVDRDEASDFGYVLLHEVHTPDGTVYEVTLPQRRNQGVLADDALPTTTLRFPIKRFMQPPPAKKTKRSGVLRDDDAADGTLFEHIVRILKAPITGAIDAVVARSEPAPTPLRVAADGTLHPLTDGLSWHTLFDQPRQEQRVLLYIHGFLSDSEASLPRTWLPWLLDRYDAVVAYTHPTLTRNPLRNVTDLLDHIPPDLRLHMDIVAHSRGGLVARSLVELASQIPQVSVGKLMTCGTPHNGTPLARHEQWDTLASVMLTATSWVLTLGGAPFAIKLLPKLIEQILKAGSKHFFGLQGVNALVPGNAFLSKLNATNTPSVMADDRYAAVISSFAIESIAQVGFKQALGGLVAQAFMHAPNDLIIPTDSMNAIDALTAPFGGKQYAANVNHFGYFDNPAVAAFAQTFLHS